MSQGTAGLTILSNSINYADSANLDSFSRVRVSNPTPLFSVQCQYNTATIQLEAGNTGTGISPSHNADTRMVQLSTTAGTGTSFLQSFQYLPYQAGNSQLIYCTGVMGTRVANAVVNHGYFDTYNGIMYRQNGTSGLQFVKRSSTSGSIVEEVINQSSWNVDKFDGSGVSGITIDDTKDHILVIDLQFLGMGRVRIGFDINGVIYWGHYFQYANVIDTPYMQSATLPIQMLLTATSTATTKYCYFKCASVKSEGGIEDPTAYRMTTPEATATAGNGTPTHLISVRPRTTFNSIINRTMFVLEEVNLFNTGANDIFWQLGLGATFSAAPTFANINTNYSAYDYGTGGTFTNFSSGIVIASGYITKNNGTLSLITHQASNRYPLTLDRAGVIRTMGTLTLIGTGIQNTSTFRGTIGFKEIR